MEETRKKRDLVTVEVRPELRKILDEITSADPELDASKAFRRALRHWIEEAPQATSPEELWLLVAMRKLKKQNPALWASALKTVNTVAKTFGAGMTPEMYESLDELTETHQPSPTKRRKSAG